MNNYKDLLLQMGFDKAQLEMFIKEQDNFKLKFEKIGDFNSKSMGSRVQPLSFNYEQLYHHIKSHYNISPKKPTTKQHAKNILKDIKSEQEHSIQTIEISGISEELHNLIFQAIDLHNTFSDMQLNHEQAEFSIMAKYDDNYDVAVERLNDIIETMLRYQDVDIDDEGRLIYFRGLWSAIEELRDMVS